MKRIVWTSVAEPTVTEAEYDEALDKLCELEHDAEHWREIADRYAEQCYVEPPTKMEIAWQQALDRTRRAAQ